MRIRQRIKASLRDYIRKFLSGDEVEDGCTGSILGADRETAMKYSAVYACVRVLGETFASTPIMLYKKRKDGTRDTSSDLPVFDILHSRPNDDMSAFGYKETCLAHLNTGGNSVSVKLKNAFGDFIGLYPLDWPKVTIERKDGALRYIYRDNGKETVYSRDEVFHVPGMSFDGIIGVSPLEYMANSIILGLSYEKFGINFYKNGAHSSGVFETPGELSDTSFSRLKDELRKNYAGLMNAGRPMILEGGLKFNGLTIKPVDAELLDSKKFGIEDVARCYRVPLHLIQNLDRATNNNIEHQSLEFVMYTMLPWFKRYEENANCWLLTPRERKQGYYLEFKLDGLLRGDAKSRAEAYAQGRQWGWLSVNDIRKMENMPPIPNGDIYLQPSNMIEAGATVSAQVQAYAKLVDDIYSMIKGAAREEVKK